MANEHVKGAVSNAKGVVNERAGKLAGDKKLEVKGKAQQAQGKARGVLGDIEDAVSRARHR